MESWKQYILSVIACALTYSIISQLISDSKRRKLMHLVLGIVLAISIFYPLSNINPEAFLQISLMEPDEADVWTAEGEKTAAEARAEYIKASCETYICDKAEKLGAKIRAWVVLDDDQIPVFAELEGVLEPDIQMQLQNILTEDLGIPKESQRWIWNGESNSS